MLTPVATRGDVIGVEEVEYSAAKLRNMSVSFSIVTLSLSISGGSVGAETQSDFGQFEYESSCATCHGPAGKGDGPMAQHLVAKPSDLTVLSKNNDGVFPAQRVYEIIDGRKEVEAHGTRTMPVWGRAFRSTVPNIEELGLADFGPQIAHARIASVVDYLYRIQEP